MAAKIYKNKERKYLTFQKTKNANLILHTKKIIKDSRFYAFAKIIPGLLGFLAVIIYTRLLTAEEYGLYILAITTISIVIAIFFEWLNKSIIRYFEIYKQSKHLSEFISTVFYTLMGLSITVLFFWYLGLNLIYNNLNPKFIILLNIGGLVIFTQAGFTFSLTIKQVSQQSFRYAILSITNSFAKLLIAICLIYFLRIGSKGILWGMVISAGSIFIWDIFPFYRKWQIKFTYFSKTLFKNFLAYGFPLIGISIASLILVAADRYMIQYFLTTVDVGIYSAGYNLANTAIQFPMAILLLAAYPIIIESFETRGERETSLLLNKILSIYFICLTPIIFGIGALGENITGVLLGEDFQKSYIILPWISSGVFCFGITQYLYKPFELKKKTKILSLLVICAAILNIILNIFFIPIFGILGAAYSTLISYVAYLTIAWLLSSKIFEWFFPWHTIVKTILASFVMFLIIRFAISLQPINILFLVIDILIGGICYSILLLLFKEKFMIQSIRYIYFKYFRGTRKKC